MNAKDDLNTVVDVKAAIKALNDAKVNEPCPRCGNKHFGIVEQGYIKLTLQKDFKNYNLGGETIPSVATICANCGYIALHALGALGLLPRVPEESE